MSELPKDGSWRTPPTLPGRENDTLDLYNHTKGIPNRWLHRFHRSVRDFLILRGRPHPSLAHTMATMLETMDAMTPEQFERFALEVGRKREADDARRHRRVRGLKNTCRDLGR